MTRATRALIDLPAVRHKLKVSQKRGLNMRQLAVIKANDDGHGMHVGFRSSTQPTITVGHKLLRGVIQRLEFFYT